jgi:DNA-binding GntR family transcriptional regulator
LRLQNACFEAPLNGYRPADSRLHLAIAELSGSPSLASAVADARVRVNDLLDAIPLLPRNIVHSNQQHARIVQAVLAGDPKAARDAMAEHLDGTAALLRAFLA